jgi:hypothetical protein
MNPLLHYTIYEACPIYGLVFLGAQNTLKLTEQGVVLETTPPPCPKIGCSP